MKMQIVTSSNIQAIGWADGILRVHFKHGGMYEYFGVPEATFNDFLAAKSQGVFFHEEIKNVFAFTKLEGVA